MLPHSSQDYSVEKLSKTKDFKIYPPLDTNFKFETLDEDLEPKVEYINGEKYVAQFHDPYPEPPNFKYSPGFIGGIDGNSKSWLNILRII
jgi:hypothetical protein